MIFYYVFIFYKPREEVIGILLLQITWPIQIFEVLFDQEHLFKYLTLLAKTGHTI